MFSGFHQPVVGQAVTSSRSNGLVSPDAGLENLI